MKLRLFILFLIALIAEVGASLWLWLSSPTDTVRVWYEGNFWAYEAVRIIPWFILFAILAAAYSLWIRKAK